MVLSSRPFGKAGTFSGSTNIKSFFDSAGPSPCTRSWVILFISINATPISFCHITRRIKVSTVRIVQDVSFFRQFLFTRARRHLWIIEASSGWTKLRRTMELNNTGIPPLARVFHWRNDEDCHQRSFPGSVWRAESAFSSLCPELDKDKSPFHLEKSLLPIGPQIWNFLELRPLAAWLSTYIFWENRGAPYTSRVRDFTVQIFVSHRRSPIVKMVNTGLSARNAEKRINTISKQQ